MFGQVPIARLMRPNTEGIKTAEDLIDSPSTLRCSDKNGSMSPPRKIVGACRYPDSRGSSHVRSCSFPFLVLICFSFRTALRPSGWGVQPIAEVSPLLAFDPLRDGFLSLRL